MCAAPVVGIAVEGERRTAVADDLEAGPRLVRHQMALQLGKRELVSGDHAHPVGRIVQTAERSAEEGIRRLDISAGVVRRRIIAPHGGADGHLDAHLHGRTRQRHRDLDQIARAVVELRGGLALHEQRLERRLGPTRQLRRHGHHLGKFRTARPRGLLLGEGGVAVLAVAVVGHHMHLVGLAHDEIGCQYLAQRHRSAVLGDGEPLVMEALLAVVDEDVGRLDPAFGAGAGLLALDRSLIPGRELQVDASALRLPLRPGLLRRAGREGQRRGRENHRISVYSYHNAFLCFTVPSGQSGIRGHRCCRRAGRG